MTLIETVIAGAGLTGLSAAGALPRGSYRILESEAEPGGLCRSIHHRGYTFDWTGHLLHLKGEMLAELEALPGLDLVTVPRRARVRTHGIEMPYPFQIHLHALPAEVRSECLEGFERVHGRTPDPSDFGSWCRSVFGEGITRHFMRPYNEKLQRVRLEDLDTDWVGYIPVPKIEEIRAGARGEHRAEVGYNAVFRYPARGGIGRLVSALADGIPVETGKPVQSIVASERRLEAAGESIRYRSLISTIPLPALVRSIVDAPEEVRSAADVLTAVGVLCLNLGVDGPTSEAHWNYYPEPQFCFYRVGFYHNISTASAPPGKSALYVEISARERSDLPADIRARAAADLVAAGVLRDAGQIEECVELWIDAAYAIHDRNRAAALGVILPYLERHGIIPAGRYGRWEYTSMGEAIRGGREAAAATGGIR